MTTSIDSGGGVRWTCPLCGESRTKSALNDESVDDAIAALRNHVLAADGEVHGPPYSLPPDVDDEWLLEHIDQVDRVDR